MWTKEKVLELRLSLGLTQKEFAELLGCRQQTVSEWEVGVYEPANAYGKLLDQTSRQISLSRPLRESSAVVRGPPTAAATPAPVNEPKDVDLHNLEFADYIDKGFDPAID